MAVLIVNDRPSARKVQRMWLQAQSPWRDEFFVECATLDEAIMAAREDTVNFVSLDLNLDEKDSGVATLERFLRETSVPAHRIYVSTADANDIAVVKRCLELGVADVNNPADDPWRRPPQIFSDAQLIELEKRISTSLDTALDKRIESIFVRLQEEQIKLSKLKQHEGMMTAMRAVLGFVIAGVGGWLVTTAGPAAVKAVAALLLTNGKSQ